MNKNPTSAGQDMAWILSSSNSTLLAPLLMLLVSALVFFVPLFGGPNDIPGDLGDARFNLYILEHVYRWVSGQEMSLLSPPIFYPYPYALGFSETHAGSAGVYVTFRFLGLDEYDAYKAWFAAGYVATFLAANYVLLRLSITPYLAAVAAFGFAFSLPAIVQMGHAQMTYRVAVPFCFLFILHYVQTKRPAELLKFTTAVSIQFLFNIYMGIYVLIFCAILFLVVIVSNTEFRLHAWRRTFTDFIHPLGNWKSYNNGWAITAIASLVLCATVLGFHKYTASLYGHSRPWAVIQSMVPQPQSYLMMDRLPYWAPVSMSLPDVKMRHEHQIFVGIPLLLAFLVAMVFVIGRPVLASARLKWFVYTVLVATVLFTAIGSVTLYWVIAQLPGLGAARAVARYQLVAAFPIVTSVALFLNDQITHSTRRRWKPVIVGALGFWMALDVALLKKRSFSSDESRTRVDAIVAQVDRSSMQDDTVLVYRGSPPSPFWTHQIDAMYVARSLGVPTLNGYSGNAPPGYDIRATCAGFIRSLSLYDDWATKNGFAPLASIPLQALKQGTETCDLSRSRIESSKFTRGPGLSPAAAKFIRLSDAKIERRNGSLIGSVRITNASPETVHGLSDHPLRLSWRWASPKQKLHQDWNTRVEIGEDLNPGASRTIAFPITSAPPDDRRQLQISVVAEGKFWAHQYGFRPLTAQMKRPNSALRDSKDYKAQPTEPAGDMTEAALAKQIELIAGAVQSIGSYWLLTIQVTNHSPHTIPARSSNPLRLSWRLGGAYKGVPTGWDTRVQIGNDLAPGETRFVPILISHDDVSTEDELEVTYVREGKYWAHDKGIPPIEIKFPD